MKELDKGEAIKVVDVVAAVIFNDKKDKVLVGQRSEVQNYPNKWEFIGGKIEIGELPEEALRREIKEEIGAEVTVGKLLDITEVDNLERNQLSHRVFFYECHKLEGDIKLDRAVYQKVKWIGVNNLTQLDWIEGSIGIAKKLAGNLALP